MLILPSRLLSAHTFVPDSQDGAEDPVSSESKSSSQFKETVLTILHYTIFLLSSAPAISSRFNERVLTIPCTPCPYLCTSFTRWCSLSGALQVHAFVAVQRNGAHSSRLILPPCQVHLTSVSSWCASGSRILQMHRRQVHIAPVSSTCASDS